MKANGKTYRIDRSDDRTGAVEVGRYDASPQSNREFVFTTEVREGVTTTVRLSRSRATEVHRRLGELLDEPEE